MSEELQKKIVELQNQLIKQSEAEKALKQQLDEEKAAKLKLAEEKHKRLFEEARKIRSDLVESASDDTLQSTIETFNFLSKMKTNSTEAPNVPNVDHGTPKKRNYRGDLYV